MADASQIILTPGDCPSVVPAGRLALYLGNDGHLRALGTDGFSDMISAVNVSAAVTYSRSTAPYAGSVNIEGSSPAWLFIPGFISVLIGSKVLSVADYGILRLNATDAWDNTIVDYTIRSNRAGRDFYLYACNNQGQLGFVISANASYPSGYSYETARLIGGFHCLCADVGVISGHPLSGYLAGDILPASVWDLCHRPVCSPGGMVYVESLGKWADIYLASVSGGRLVSVNGGTIADGASTPAFHWYKSSQWLGQIGKRLPNQHDFVALSLGSNQGTGIAGSADPGTTGGHVDTTGRRMISNVGCEDTCGVLWHWGAEPGGGAAGATWVAAYDGNDSGVLGSSYQAPNRVLLGGAWAAGGVCGSRCSRWEVNPLVLNPIFGARGVAEPLAVSL